MKQGRHIPIFEVVLLCQHVCVANVFDDIFDALHFELGVCCEETDGDELGAGRTWSGFSTLRCGYRQTWMSVFERARTFFDLGLWEILWCGGERRRVSGVGRAYIFLGAFFVPSTKVPRYW